MDRWNSVPIGNFLFISVERRRRDKINNWIVQLSKLVPDCAADINKQGQVHVSMTSSLTAEVCLLFE